jgi:hypothetical protein
MVTVFGVFLLYLWRHPDTEHPETFVSGVVACALLFSNVIFIATEFEFLQPPPLSTKHEELVNKAGTRS